MATHGYDLRRLIRGLVSERGLFPQQSLGGRGRCAPPVALRRRPRSPLDARCNWRPRFGWRPSIPRACPPTSVSEPFEKRIQALEESARSLASSFTTSSGDAQIGVAEALLFSNGKRIAGELLNDGPDRLVGRLEHDRPAGRGGRPGRPQCALPRRPMTKRFDFECVPRRSHRPARRRPPPARLGPAHRLRIPIQSLTAIGPKTQDSNPDANSARGRQSTCPRLDAERFAGRPSMP